MTVCTGNGTADGDHCCYVDGQECTWLRRDYAGRKFACFLRAELGSWDLVHADPRYAPIQEHWDKIGVESCGAWGPGSGQCCYSEVEVVIK